MEHHSTGFLVGIGIIVLATLVLVLSHKVIGKEDRHTTIQAEILPASTQGYNKDLVFGTGPSVDLRASPYWWPLYNFFEVDTGEAQFPVRTDRDFARYMVAEESQDRQAAVRALESMINDLGDRVAELEDER